MEERLKTYIKNCSPSAFGEASFDEIEIKKLAAGCYNVNYLVRINSKKYVFRLNIHSDECEGGNLGREYAVLKYLNGLYSPDVILFDNSFDYPLLVEQFCEGNKITELNKQIMQKIAFALGAIHKQSSPIKEKQGKNLKDFYTSIFESRRPTLEKNSTMKNELSDFIKKAENYVIDKNSKFAELILQGLLHGDMHCDNILISDSNIVFVDWENTKMGDPVFDIVAFFYESENLQYFDKSRSLTPELKEFFIDEYLNVNPDRHLREKLEIIYPLRWLEDTLWLASRIINYEDIPKESRDKPLDRYKELYRFNLYKLHKLWKN